MPKKDSSNSLNPEQASSSTIEKTLQEISRKELADKVMAGKRLTESEKIEICHLLTGGESPEPKKRGRKSTIKRDIHMAADYLRLRGENEGQLLKLRKSLAKEHGFAEGGHFDDDAFYKAIQRGVIKIMGFCTKKKHALKGDVSELSTAEQEIHETIDLFLESKKQYDDRRKRTRK